MAGDGGSLFPTRFSFSFFLGEKNGLALSEGDGSEMPGTDSCGGLGADVCEVEDALIDTGDEGENGVEESEELGSEEEGSGWRLDPAGIGGSGRQWSGCR